MSFFAAGAEEQQVIVLKEAVAGAVATLDEGLVYPCWVGSAWLCVLGVEKGKIRANLLVCLADGKVKASSTMEVYRTAFVDDDDGCEETREEFMAYEKDHATPADAVSAYVQGEHELGHVGAETAAICKRVFGRWLSGRRWAALRGNFVRAHELPDIAERCLETMGQAVLEFPRYSFLEPSDPEFIDSLGLECDDEAYAQGFVGSFVRVFKCNGDAALSRTDLDHLVEDAIRKQKQLDKLSKTLEYPSSKKTEEEEEEEEEDDENEDSDTDDDDDYEIDPADVEPRTCRHCGEGYTRAENTADACLEWDAGRHSGKYVVNKRSSFWDGWQSDIHGPPDSKFCKEEYSRQGDGYIWTGCGCHNGPDRDDECLRTTPHSCLEEHGPYTPPS